MAHNLLKNGGFEADWGDEKSHHCMVFTSGGSQEKIIGNIFTPPEWTTWFRHDPGTWDQPEVRDAWKEHDPNRVHGGQKGMLLFTFYRGHDAGFFQQVQVAPGTKLRLTAWAHAWSNHLSREDGGRPDDGRWSDGAGYEEVAWEAGTIPSDTGDPQVDAKGNFTFYVGIDPTGGADPLADTVVWGPGYHVYNGYCRKLAVDATSQASTVTVFLRSKTLWKFKHSDAYWDEAELLVVDGGDGNGEPPQVNLSHIPTSPKVGQAVTITARAKSSLTDIHLEVRQPAGAKLAMGVPTTGKDGDWYTWTYTTSPLSEAGTHNIAFSASDDAKAAGEFKVAGVAPPPRGQPRVQYDRTYVLLAPDANEAWALAAVDGSWQHKYTVGGSADDSGIGDLNVRRVIAVNPARWPTDLHAFFKEYYAGVEYIPVEANTPAQLREKLKNL